MTETILETIIKEKEKKDAFNIEPHSLVFDLLNELKDNEKDILVRRFGLLKQRYETLEQVGRDKGVTRERIRQIEKNSIKKLKDLHAEKEKLKLFKKNVIRILEEYGGLMKETHLLDVLLEDLGLIDSAKRNKQAIAFILNNLFEELRFLKNHPDFYDSWYLPKISIESIKEIISQIEERIEERKELVNQIYLMKIFDEIDVEKKPFEAYLKATRKIEQNNFGEWGIASWPTVTPKRISDKAYLVFKKEDKPLHFTRVAELINEASFSDKKVANTGTVHNELIMDDRYVLIGRGTYVLKEWGFTEGTVSDVIVRLLKEKGPMNRDEIIKRVSKQRMVHENTIKVALINKDLFKKLDKQKYELADE